MSLFWWLFESIAVNYNDTVFVFNGVDRLAWHGFDWEEGAWFVAHPQNSLE